MHHYWTESVECLGRDFKPLVTGTKAEIEIDEVSPRGRARPAGARVKVGTSPAGVEWVAYRPEDVEPMTARLAALRAKTAAVAPAVARKPATMRHLYVLTVRDKKGTKLAELTGDRTARGAVVRLWNASQRKWQKGTSVVDFAHGYFVDERPARDADLKKYGFTLPPGHHLAS